MDIKGAIRKLPLGRVALGCAGDCCRSVRRTYLRRRYRGGRYIQCNGVDLFCDFYDSTHEWYGDPSDPLAFDQAILRMLLDQSQGDTIVDIGAHLGFFTAYLCGEARRMARPVRMIAMEPDRRHFRCLQRTMAAAAYPDAILLRAALSATDGRVGMYDSAGSCLHTYGGGPPRYWVEGMRLDSVARAHAAGRRVALIKIDVDGAEQALFSGGVEVLREHKPLIYMEFAPAFLGRAGVDVSAFLGYLCDNFTVYWANAKTRSVPLLNREAAQNFLLSVGDGVTDLVLSNSRLNLETSSSPMERPGR